MFARPHARVNDELELSVVKLEKSYNIVSSVDKYLSFGLTRETVQINSTKECKEFDSVLRELGKVLVDHFQSAFKHILHNRRNLILHERLKTKLVSFQIKFALIRVLYTKEIGDAPLNIWSDEGSNVQKAS
jgi:hypothetical protein